MTIGKPTAKLAVPNSIALPKGALIERIHNRNYAANAFNPCRGGPKRFAPIEDSNGACIPSLYAGETLEAAIYETVFHDIPAKAKRKTVPKFHITSRAHGQLEVLRDLKLASLRALDLKKWLLRKNELIATSPKLYSQTAKWAAAIHHQFTDIEGLIWTSNQCDPDAAYLFFGDRVNEIDFRVVLTRDGQIDITFLEDIRRAGMRGDISITV
ncbi:MAG: RES family NAD+ phosphorylase [Candidatus Competibacterales bacterium]